MESPKQEQSYDAWNQGAGSRCWTFPSRPTVRRSGKLLLDGALAAAAWALACALLHGAPPTARGTALFTVLALAVNTAFGFTSQHYRLVGFTEAWALLRGSLVITTAALVFCALHGAARFQVEGADICCSAGLLTGAMWFGLRVLAMRLHRRRFTAQPEPAGSGLQAERTLIVGAGRAGMRLCQELREHPRLDYQVLGFVDDALEKQGVRIEGVPVLGPTRLLQTFVREQNATLVILGMAGAPGAKIRELSQKLQAGGIRVKTVPGILDLVGDHPWKPEVRDIAIEDLLRREAVNLDTGAIRHALEGSVALITGAGGSIGSELCRRVASFRPGCLVLLGRGENSLWEIERDLRRLYPDQVMAVALCDIRNRVRLHQVFETWRPQVVFHAAAHKHVPYLEQNPEEGIGNNIFGTQNVLKAALAAAARIVVNVSTDKAVNPVNVLGVTKRIGEHLVLQAAAQAPKGSRYVSVRFGNVLGSRGSVLTALSAQVAAGGPVTVTDPEVSRYFMLADEAVHLLLQAAVIGRGGEVLVLDMGEPVRIADMARRMAVASGLQVDIVFTGLRPGEKLFEDRLAQGENDLRPYHPLISQVPVPPLSAAEVVVLDPDADADSLYRELARLARSSSHDGRRAIPAQSQQTPAAVSR